MVRRNTRLRDEEARWRRRDFPETPPGASFLHRPISPPPLEEFPEKSFQGCVYLCAKTARIEPIRDKHRPSARQHQAFGLWSDRPETSDPSAYVRKLRKGRFDAL
jgi:hypothetical protein